jgi:hypothetical protein
MPIIAASEKGTGQTESLERKFKGDVVSDNSLAMDGEFFWKEEP